MSLSQDTKFKANLVPIPLCKCTSRTSPHLIFQPGITSNSAKTSDPSNTRNSSAIFIQKLPPYLPSLYQKPRQLVRIPAKNDSRSLAKISIIPTNQRTPSSPKILFPMSNKRTRGVLENMYDDCTTSLKGDPYWPSGSLDQYTV